MNAPAVIVVQVGPENTAQMPLVQHYHMVECIPTNAADDPFTVRILPRRSRGCLHLFDPQCDSVLKTFAVDAGTIPDQITRNRIPGKRFHNLLRRPCRSRMFGHIEMHDTPTLASRYDKHEEHPEFSGWDSEEIAEGDIFSVVLKLN